MAHTGVPGVGAGVAGGGVLGGERGTLQQQQQQQQARNQPGGAKVLSLPPIIPAGQQASAMSGDDKGAAASLNASAAHQGPKSVGENGASPDFAAQVNQQQQQQQQQQASCFESDKGKGMQGNCQEPDAVPAAVLEAAARYKTYALAPFGWPMFTYVHRGSGACVSTGGQRSP